MNKAGMGRGVPRRTLRDCLPLDIFIKRKIGRKVVLS